MAVLLPPGTFRPMVLLPALDLFPLMPARGWKLPARKEGEEDYSDRLKPLLWMDLSRIKSYLFKHGRSKENDHASQSN